MLIAGVDEAGRGPVVGPLVVAGVTFKDHQIPALRNLKVKDSRVLTPKRRTVLNTEIRKIAIQCEVLELSPFEVDKIVFEGWKLHRLNWLEAVTMAKVIQQLHPQVAYVDAADVIEARFGKQIREAVPFKVRVISKHHADANYPIVSAASIVAKVHRDEAVAFLREKYGDFGSGYPHDPKTKKFLQSCAEKAEFPDCVRMSWKTITRLI